jgi:hypothetical protein
MKVKVVIENGETTIFLTPQNEFEIDLIEKVRNKKEKHTIQTEFCAEYNFGSYKNHYIELSIKEESP